MSLTEPPGLMSETLSERERKEERGENCNYGMHHIQLVFLFDQFFRFSFCSLSMAVPPSSLLYSGLRHTRIQERKTLKHAVSLFWMFLPNHEAHKFPLFTVHADGGILT